VLRALLVGVVLAMPNAAFAQEQPPAAFRAVSSAGAVGIRLRWWRRQDGRLASTDSVRRRLIGQQLDVAEPYCLSRRHLLAQQRSVPCKRLSRRLFR
jgi:hypothetical protein